MASKKLNEAVTVHMSAGLAEAIKNVSFKKGITPSKWFRDLADKELKEQRLQAQFMVDATLCLENDENYENYDDE